MILFPNKEKNAGLTMPLITLFAIVFASYFFLCKIKVTNFISTTALRIRFFMTKCKIWSNGFRLQKGSLQLNEEKSSQQQERF